MNHASTEAWESCESPEVMARWVEARLSTDAAYTAARRFALVYSGTAAGRLRPGCAPWVWTLAIGAAREARCAAAIHDALPWWRVCAALAFGAVRSLPPPGIGATP